VGHEQAQPFDKLRPAGQLRRKRDVSRAEKSERG
jgi:hypothetical protein